MKVTALTLLKDAREILSDEKRWTQDTFARNENGDEVFYNDDSACMFCSLGALRKAHTSAYGELNSDSQYYKAIKALNWQLRTAMAEDAAAAGFTVSMFNDNATHEQVLRMFDGAIKDLET